MKLINFNLDFGFARAAALPKDYGGEYLQMRLSYSPYAPFFLFLMEWMDCSCMDTLPSYLGLLHILIYKVYVDGMSTMSSHERKATLREFYGLHFCDLIELEDNSQRGRCMEVLSRKRVEERRKLFDKDPEREDECGICMESCTKMVLPNCSHSMCISCFHDWNMRSQSCPFCRGSLKRVKSRDLWVLTSNSDIVDTTTLAKENLRCFYLYIDNLPLEMPETTVFYVYDYMI
ncbi:hypothetical protein HHK36_025102 [Tetracentron sinense]|uniref:RING-type domain-containing protein n=1 Tax=Tetracentron sinense TaxID=13715 RepID=A0A834YM24_TETSI|nr:hypothetical protein HHK36_025102 [Tetracentron sinense]